MLSSPERIYFKGLNELRAFAALGVVWHHIELYKNREGIPGLYQTVFHNIISGLGHNGVNLFFVLSGFLITYLLLVEKERSGTVNVKLFYVRRILRIWPLYYFVILYSMFLIPFIANSFEIFKSETHYYNLIQQLPQHFGVLLILFLLILPNFALLLGFKPVVGASQTWSIGIEEQFYYLWPWVMRKFKKKSTWILCLIWPLKLMVAWSAQFAGSQWHMPALTFFSKWLMNFQIELMSLGGVGAILLYYYREKMTALFADVRMKTGILIGLGIALNLHFYQSGFITGFFFCLLILSVTVAGGIQVGNRTFDYLGRISYGIYMYHPLVMFLVFPFTRQLGIASLPAFNLIIYLTIFSITIALSHFSFNYFESYFIRLKDRFAIVRSFSGNPQKI